MRNRTYGGVRGRKTKVGRKLLRFPPTRLVVVIMTIWEHYIVHDIKLILINLLLLFL